jgi:hypothetical protein
MASPIFSSDFNDATVIGDLQTGLNWDANQAVASGTLALESTIIPRVGTKSIKCVAPAYSSTIARAALQKAAFSFSAYTATWIEWYLYIAAAASYHMLGLLDVEDPDHPSGLSAGRSLYMTKDRMLHSALLNAGQIDIANQPITGVVAGPQMPIAQWVKMRAYIFFDADAASGRVKLWRDDVLILDEAGRTMPPGMYVTDRIQIGITNHEAPVQQTLYVADVKVWTGEPDDGLSPPSSGGGGGGRHDVPTPDGS